MPLPIDYRGLLSAKLVPMSEEESHLFIKLMTMEMDRNCKLHQDVDGEFGFKVMQKRLAAAGIPVSVPLTVFLLCLCNNPANCVLWCYTLCWIWKDLSYTGTPINIVEWSKRFAMGIPEESEYNRLWDLQKCPHDERHPGMTDNWIDNFAVWPLPNTAAQTA